MNKVATLLFYRRENEILLAMKKRGFGEGRWNGVGGKVEKDESIEEALVRESQEEIGVAPNSLGKVALLNFTFPDGSPDWEVHVYFSDKYDGEPTETEEMKPKWFDINNIPYEQMWEDDIYWLPLVIDGKKIEGKFAFDNEDKLLKDSIVIDEL